MMNKITFLLFFLSIITLTSCGDCEDKTIQVDNYLLNWLPYSSETSVSFSYPNNQTLNFTISPSETLTMEDDGDCIKTSIQPFIFMQNDNQPEFVQIWFKRDDNDRDQLWAIIKENEQIQESGAIINLNDPDLSAKTVTLNGIDFDEVISLNLNPDPSVNTTIYLQKNIGIIGFHYNGILSVIN